ncbi:hypothetical protein FRB96_007773 [Tulasnella sp. 330]|nr:hypothetical protein FRB96_007773 [Tulasnella sp. 330]
MVIMWPNNDGTLTLSQRMATDHIMPQVVPNPPEIATLDWTNSILTLTNSTSIAFNYPIPASLNHVDMIFAWSTVRPSSNAVDAILQQHTESGPYTMDLTQSVGALPTGTFFVNSGGTTVVGAVPTATASSGNGTTTPPTAFTGVVGLTRDQNRIRTHARFSRTVPFLQRKWFTAHWMVQLLLTGPIIIAGLTFANLHVPSTASNHRQIGWTLLGLYIAQFLLGIIIHFFKPKPKWIPGPAPGFSELDSGSGPAANGAEKGQRPIMMTQVNMPKNNMATDTEDSTPSTVPHRNLDPLSPTYHASSLPPCNRYPAICARPPQNYLHAILGLTIIGLAFHQVQLGYKREWEYIFGMPYSSTLMHINSWWISWVIIIPCIYVAGLTLLPRQWNLEAAASQPKPANLN